MLQLTDLTATCPVQAKARYKEQVLVLAKELGALQRRTAQVSKLALKTPSLQQLCLNPQSLC